MQHIKSQDTSIEIILRKKLWAEGFRYRKNYKLLPGKPDIVLTKHKIAIFCDSEFFHGKDWTTKRERLSHSLRGDYWIRKIEQNMERDNEINKRLRYLGWHVVRFWGADIKKDPDSCILVIKELIFDTSITNSGDKCVENAILF